jgi:type IV pilus assembly protein PilE
MKVEKVGIVRQAGFTLIELMVTVAIVGFLTMIAIPSYEDFMVRARCSDGYEALTSVAQSQERYYLNNYSYTTSFTTLGYGTAAQLSSEEYYTVALQACASGGITACVEVTATGRNAQSNANTLYLNTRGDKRSLDGFTTVNGWECN